MCKSRAEGGQRCATHTRPEYLKALAPADEDRELTFEEKILLGAASVPYATTIKGAKVILEDIAKFNKEGKVEVAAILRIAMLEGQKQREKTKEIETLIMTQERGVLFALSILSQATEGGLNRWQAYQKVCEVADTMKVETIEEITGKDMPEEIKIHIKYITESITKVMISTALDFYAQLATAEEVSMALFEREFNQREEGDPIDEAEWIAPNDLSDLEEPS